MDVDLSMNEIKKVASLVLITVLVVSIVTVALFGSNIVPLTFKPVAAQSANDEWTGQYSGQMSVHSDTPFLETTTTIDSGSMSFKILFDSPPDNFGFYEIIGKVHGHESEVLDRVLPYAKCHSSIAFDYDFTLIGSFDPETGKVTLGAAGDGTVSITEESVYTCILDNGQIYSGVPADPYPVSAYMWGGADWFVLSDGHEEKIESDPSIKGWTWSAKFTVHGVLEEKIEVEVDKPTLSPADTNPKSKVTITATRQAGSKIKQMEIKIEACTEIGNKGSDGHKHDSERREDPCDKKSRTGPVLKYQGKEYKENVIAKTDDKGQIILEYEPPFNYQEIKDKKTHEISINKAKKLYISGVDKITATKVSDPKIKDDASITTKVSGLQVMPGSPNCSIMDNYYFVKQGQHGCLFYGTPTTNNAMARIAKAFMDKQEECKNKPGGICTIKDAMGNNVTLTITGENKKVRITAMSLPWGGTHDIKGDWKNPHVTHQLGKGVDIGLADLATHVKDSKTKQMETTYDVDRIKLLWYIISLDANYSSFAQGEGNPFSYTVDHFHVNFKS